MGAVIRRGVTPRTAQAAMTHSDIRLTMGVYTDPKLPGLGGALDSLRTPRLLMNKRTHPKLQWRREQTTNGDFRLYKLLTNGCKKGHLLS
ncbi:MAG: hypothetical protein EXS16_16010 [Gemmataceae bacterium]|nr:hypothetical protein [Gemmataceae bacterium]